MTFTKERLEEIAEDGFLKHGESKELARMALAGMETTHNSVIAEQLDHVLSGMDVTAHQRAVIRCAVDRLNKNAELLQQAPQPLTTSERAELENYRNAQQVILIKYQTQVETAKQVWNIRIINTPAGAPKMKISGVDYEKLRIEEDIASIKKSIDTPTVKRPEWIKSGRDFVKWMKMRRVRSITQHFDGIALETAREIMCDVNRRNEFLGGDVQLLSRIQCRVDDACRAAMLQGKAEPVTTAYKLPANTPCKEAPDGCCIMPMKLTADNGAKGALSGEFHVTHRIICQSCGGEGCEDCNEDGGWDAKIPIGWDTIKRIHEAAVEACALPAAPQQETE